jgi:hypothetical protein
MLQLSETRIASLPDFLSCTAARYPPRGTHREMKVTVRTTRVKACLLLIFCSGALNVIVGAAPLFRDQSPHEQATLTDGFIDQETHDADRAVFEEQEIIASGLGPIYNAQSCAECHHSPVSGGAGEISVIRAGHINESTSAFVEPPGGSLMHAHAIDPAIDIRIPDSEDVRSRRITVPLLGDGYIEAIDDSTLISIARAQPAASHGRIAGQVAYVPVLEGRTHSDTVLTVW